MNQLKKYWLTIFQLFLILYTAYYNFQLFNRPKIGGNGASRILLALGPIFNIGVPYKDLYEFVPPGFLLLATGWIKLFGTSMIAFRSFQVFFVVCSGLLILAICKKLFKNKLIELAVFSAATISLHSGIIQSDIFSLDFIAATFTLTGLTSLLYVKNLNLKLLLSSTFLFFASQIKDIYLFSLLALLPYYIREFLSNKFLSFFKITFLSLAGPFLIIAGSLFYLITNNAFVGYLQIVKDKSTFVNIPSPIGIINNLLTMIEVFELNFLQFSYQMQGLLFLVLVLLLNSFFFSLKKNKHGEDNK